MPQDIELYKQFKALFEKLMEASKMYKESELKDILVKDTKVERAELSYPMVSARSKDDGRNNWRWLSLIHGPTQQLYEIIRECVSDYVDGKPVTRHFPETGTNADLKELKARCKEIESALKEDAEKGETLFNKAKKYFNNRDFQSRDHSITSDSVKSEPELTYTLKAKDKCIEIRFNKKTGLLQSRGILAESDDYALQEERGFTNVHHGSDTYKSIKEILAEIKANSAEKSTSKKVSGLGAGAAGDSKASQAGHPHLDYRRGVVNPLYDDKGEEEPETLQGPSTAVAPKQRVGESGVKLSGKLSEGGASHI